VMVDRMEFLEAGADEKFSFSLERGSKVIVRDSGFFNYVTNGLAYGTARKRIRINGVPLDRVHVAAPSNVAVIGRSATINYGTLYQNIFLDEAEPVKTSVINQVFDQADRLRLTSLLTKPRGLSTLFEPSDLRLDFSDIVKLWLLRCMFSRFDFLLVDDIWDRMEKVDANLCQTYIADELSDRAQLLVFNAGVPRILTDYQLVAPARPPTLLRREAIG
jgi:ABC-type transport system involved in cytochrome bd biosynthesis fused ATPase/permease subunit